MEQLKRQISGSHLPAKAAFTFGSFGQLGIRAILTFLDRLVAAILMRRG